MIAFNVRITEYIEFEKTETMQPHTESNLEMRIIEGMANPLLKMFNAPNIHSLMIIIQPYILNYVMQKINESGDNVVDVLGQNIEVSYDFLKGVAMAFAMTQQRK